MEKSDEASEKIFQKNDEKPLTLKRAVISMSFPRRTGLTGNEWGESSLERMHRLDAWNSNWDDRPYVRQAPSVKAPNTKKVFWYSEFWYFRNRENSERNQVTR